MCQERPISGIDSKNILIDLRGAYAANVTSLPEIETAINQLLKAAGRTVGVTVLRDNLELVYAANVLNLLSAIQAGGDEGECLRNTFLKIAAPERNVPSPDLSKLRKYSDSTQDLFTWLVNYRRQQSFDQRKMTALLAQVDAIH